MRVRMTRRPTEDSIDGIPLWHLEVGHVYAFPMELATLMIVEGWAEPVVDAAEPTLPSVRFNIAQIRERRQRFLSAARLRRHLGIAADRRQKK